MSEFFVEGGETYTLRPADPNGAPWYRVARWVGSDCAEYAQHIPPNASLTEARRAVIGAQGRRPFARLARMAQARFFTLASATLAESWGLTHAIEVAKAESITRWHTREMPGRRSHILGELLAFLTAAIAHGTVATVTPLVGADKEDPRLRRWEPAYRGNATLGADGHARIIRALDPELWPVTMAAQAHS